MLCKRDLLNSTAAGPQGNLRQDRQVPLWSVIAVARKATNKATADQHPGVNHLGRRNSGPDPLDVIILSSGLDPLVAIEIALAKSIGAVRVLLVDQDLDVPDLHRISSAVGVLNVFPEVRTNDLGVGVEDPAPLRVPDRLTPLKDRGVNSGIRIILTVETK